MVGGEGERGRLWLHAGDVERFAECMAGGGVALFPADTVYGLACDPLQPRAVRRLYELKGRPPARPAAVMFFALAPALAALGELGPRTCAALQALLPGPLTVLLPNPADRFPLACRPSSERLREQPSPGRPADGATGMHEEMGASDALGLRVPLLPEPLAALGALERPVLQSSANLSGGPEARRLADVAPALRESVDLALDGGELPGVASTVLDLREYERGGRWRVVRAGPVGGAALERSLGPA
jgi:L-threonylcarbamoyladenylate synthase